MYSVPRISYLAGIRTTIQAINRCVGVLIAPKYVLTAHREPTPSSDYQYISLGPLYDNPSTGETIKIETWMRHPNYNEKTQEYNYYLFKLKTASKFTPVRMESGSGVNVPDDSAVTVLSWAQVDKAPVLIDMWLVNQKLCKQYVRVFGTTVCTVADGWNDACRINTGSALIVGLNGVDVLVGLMNYNNGCGTRYPTVFNRIWAARTWIKSVTGV